MSDIKLFRVRRGGAEELQGTSVSLEREIQDLIERNLDAFLGVRFLATEYTTGEKHRGRIDTLGLDENGCPVILEYKRELNENVINQGLFYLDWLMDHKAEFEHLVRKKCGAKSADDVDWSGPRLICIASDFTRYDEHAVQQMGHNVELVRYRHFPGELLREHSRKVGTHAASLAVSASSWPLGERSRTRRMISRHRPALR